MRNLIGKLLAGGVAAMLTLCLNACGNDDEPDGRVDEVPAGEATDVAANLPGLWMEIGYTELRAEAGAGNDVRVSFSGKDNTYRWVRMSFNDDGTVEAEWHDNDNRHVVSSHTLTLEGNLLYNGETMAGTVTKCILSGESTSDPELIIVWEKNARPFNLGSAYRTEARYLRDTWTKSE